MAAWGWVAGRSDKGPTETSQGDGCVQYLGHGGGLTGICVCHNSSSHTL